MEESIVVVAYEPDWPRWFAEMGTRLRRELGGVALRIDHIGSTAVPGLDAKPIIDIQVSVASFEPSTATGLQSNKPVSCTEPTIPRGRSATSGSSREVGVLTFTSDDPGRSQSSSRFSSGITCGPTTSTP